jgi:hypothetical protein
MCNVQRVVTGNAGKAFAAFAIISIGVGFFTGKVSWGLMIGVAAGIAAMFGAATIVSAITGKTTYQVSALTYCPGNYKDAVKVESNLIVVKYPNVAPYAESTDIGSLSYDYSKNKVEIITHLKRDSYYKKKFANYTPQQIYQEAIADGNIDKETGLIATCHICGMYGYKYCFKFKSLTNPPHDKYYMTLQKSCN